MRLINETWEPFSLPDGVELEEPITALFHEALLKVYDHEAIHHIGLEDPVIDSDDGSEVGRNDLRFYKPSSLHRQKDFFVVECKRLYAPMPSGVKALVSDYFNEGVLRFVSGKYAKDGTAGAMLAYVMKASVEDAFSKIREAMIGGKYPVSLAKPPWVEPSATLPGCSASADSRHVRSNGDFTLHHLLVSCPLN